jgi:ABC-type transporter Mla subunit MlaD
MQKEHIFRRAFMGGFNREDVLRYIEELKLNESLLMRKFKEKEEEFSRTLLEKEVQFKDALAAKDRELSEANEKISRLQSDIAIALKECERLKAESDKKEAIAQQLGNAIIDARKYSDQLIERSKQEAKRIDEATAKTVDTVSQKIDELELDINKTARQFATAFNALLDELEELKNSLSGFSTKEVEGQNRMESKTFEAIKDNVYDLSNSL